MKKRMTEILAAGMVLTLLSGCSIYTQDDIETLNEQHADEIAEYESKCDEYEAEIEDYKEEIEDYKEKLEEYETLLANQTPDASSTNTTVVVLTDAEIEDAYAALLDDYIVATGNEDLIGQVFNFNEDGIPDYYIFDRDVRELEVYSVDDEGYLNYIVADAYAGNFYYYEGIGIMVMESQWNQNNGTGLLLSEYYIPTPEDTYEFGDVPDMKIEYEAQYTENGELVEDGEATYYIDEEEVTESDFNDLLSGYGIAPYEVGDSRIADGCIGYTVIE